MSATPRGGLLRSFEAPLPLEHTPRTNCAYLPTSQRVPQSLNALNAIRKSLRTAPNGFQRKTAPHPRFTGVSGSRGPVWAPRRTRTLMNNVFGDFLRRSALRTQRRRSRRARVCSRGLIPVSPANPLPPVRIGSGHPCLSAASGALKRTLVDTGGLRARNVRLRMRASTTHPQNRNRNRQSCYKEFFHGENRVTGVSTTRAISGGFHKTSTVLTHNCNI